ncbi:MAG TPA: winged helix-turn-helix domain-containing protein [Pyrinomonadaceae bacterium]|nr:winged helix-turn-helix domain-containing protein [Pyrinomonadaceae bacterium]
MSKLNVRVNRKRPESMTRQIREQLDELIDAGTLAAGTLLPSERDLANTLKVARNVVRGAYEQLMEAGKLRSEGRRGRSVRSGTSGGGSKSSGKSGGTKKRSTKSTKKARKK